MSSHSAIEKCFQDAEDSGILRISHKGLKCFPNFVDEYDLVDVLFVDISRNRFVELPQELLTFVMVEKMICSNNFLKTLPDLSILYALTYLDVSQNQMQSIPVHICSLPLKILKASHNHINNIPCEIGLLSKLQAMDISCNNLSNLPSTMGDLSALRQLNVRRNEIVVLPDELSKLKNLCTLDFSCNRISSIPPAFRLISSLIKLDLTNNPLSSPPAQICLKGRLHIVKYLSMAAQQQEKRWSVLKDTNNTKNNSPSSSMVSTNNAINGSLSSEIIDSDLSMNLTSEKNLLSHEEANDKDFVDSIPIDSVKKINATKEEGNFENPGPEEVKPPLHSPSKPKLPKKPNPSVLSSTVQETREKQEKGKLTQKFQTRIPTVANQPNKTSRTPTTPSTTSVDSVQPDSTTVVSGKQLKNKDSNVEANDRSEDDNGEDREKKLNIEARKEKLLKNKEEIIKSRQRLENLKSKNIQRDSSLNKVKPEIVSPTSTTSQDSNKSEGVVFEGINKRGSLAKPRSANKKLGTSATHYTMNRFYDAAKEEFSQLEKLREAMETRLRIKLPDDLPASLSDGIVLCHLINHLRKGTIQVIHVPSSGVPKLTMPKCQMNVDAFLDACRRVGVAKSDICTAPDILEEKSPTKLCRTVQSLLQALGAAPPQVNLVKPTTPR